MVTAIDMRGEGGLVLAAQPIGHDGGEAAKDEAIGIDQDPALLDIGRLDGMSLGLKH